LFTEQVLPVISVVIVSYNTLEMTHDCLLSVYQNIGSLNSQVIVVDNDSKDGSAEMVREAFPDAILIANDKNLGFAAANNQGFSFANGEFVLLLNSDTIVLGDVLGRSVECMRANPNVGAMGCRVLNTDRTMQPTCSGYPTLVRLLLMTIGLNRILGIRAYDRYLLRGWERDTERDVEVISGCYLLVRREVLDAVGGLDDSFFFFGEETDWCLRIRKAGWQLRFSPVGEIIHHGGGSVKKLNHQRDVMLTEAIIRLHQKNGCAISAVLAFLILAFFNLSRAVIWSILSIVNSDCRARAKHFRAVVFCTFETWPAPKGR
jgi:GT2 family glycosyltransferase